MNIRLIIFVLLASITAFSCKKDSGNDDSARKKLLVGKWKYTHFILDFNKNKVVDDSLFIIPDTISYFYDFKSNGSMDVIDSHNPQSPSIPWSFQDNETKLQLGIANHTAMYDIYELTTEKLMLAMDMPTGLSGSDSLVYSWFIFAKQ